MITGGVQGIGAEIAQHLTKDGFVLALADLAQQAEAAKTRVIIQEIEAAGQKGIFIELGITD